MTLNKIQALRLIGFLTIRNVGNGFFFTEETVDWRVEFEIRLPEQFYFTKKVPGTLDAIIDELWEEATIWLSFHYPDYFKELIDRYNAYADEPQPVPSKLECYQ